MKNEEYFNQAKGIWVIADQTNGHIHSVTYELLGKAQELKKKLGSEEPVTAVVLGSNICKDDLDLGAFGAEKVLLIDHPSLNLFCNDVYADVLEKEILERKPEIILMAATATGSDLAPVLGARLKTGVAAHCVDLKINEQKELVSVVPAFGGKVLGDILCPYSRPQIATLKPGVLTKPERVEGIKPLYENITVEEFLTDKAQRVKAIKIVEEKISGIPIEEADIIVAGGWGMGSKENWEHLEELAELLEAGVGCTRPAVDEKWVEGEHQMIGTSGKTVRPKIYIGAGISGATHHICGMKDSGYIISINKEEDAPIFDVSDVGVVGDAAKILALLNSEIKAKKA